jgi:hypothetical protein
MIRRVSIRALWRAQEAQMSEQAPELLTKSFELGYTYTRSTGPVIGHFLTEMREGRIVGTRTTDGRVLVPAAEFDPVSADALKEFVPVADEGTVTTWSWVAEPISHHLLQKPFAFALIRLDGADVAMLHMVDAGTEGTMKTGMRVRARWAPERRGSITDITCFEPA